MKRILIFIFFIHLFLVETAKALDCRDTELLTDIVPAKIKIFVIIWQKYQNMRIRLLKPMSNAKLKAVFVNCIVKKLKLRK